MRSKITMQDLRTAKRLGKWQLTKGSEFYIRNYGDNLKRPGVVIKRGTVVEAVKVYRRGRAVLLKYTDRTGKLWWSWTHASEYEEPRKYEKQHDK